MIRMFNLLFKYSEFDLQYQYSTRESDSNTGGYVLDDLKMIHSRDSQDTLGIVQKQSEQLLGGRDAPQTALKTEGLSNIVYVGLGSSGLAGMIARSWLGLGLPFEVVRDYDLPPYVGGKTLCILASYSGNSEETLTALGQAEAKGAHIGVITAGGKLAEAAAAKGYPLITLAKTMQPRFAALANVRAIMDLLGSCGLLDTAQYSAELTGAAAFLDESVRAWLPELPTGDNPAKQLAQELMGRSVVVYSGPFLAPAAYKWKIAINENAKQIAWTGQYPEANHNEFAGWSQQPHDKPYAVIDLRSSFDNDRVSKRLEVTARLLSGKRPAPLIVQAEGESRLQQLLWVLAFGDFVSIYLALLNGIDPAPLSIVDTFKKAMEE